MRIFLSGCLVLLLAAAQSGLLRAEGSIRLQLNKLEPADPDCRAYLVLVNETPHDFDKFQLELVTFAPDGVINQRATADLPAIPSGKTVVSLHDIPDVTCGDIARILVNDVSECRTNDGEVPSCTNLLSLSALPEVEFWK